jgi:molecular chaperone HtpG
MAQPIQFPDRLKHLLEKSPYEAAVRDLANRVGEILADNKMTFFPDYTDHGVAHINDVLASEVQLIPEEVWNTTQPGTSKPLLTDADAAVIIGATLLHDLGMHLHPQGFRELIGHGSRFRPLPWFDSKQEGYWGDRPWADLWEDYAREARRFSGKQLANIIGEDAAKTNWKFDTLPASDGEWTLNHRLIVGEFIRRHHARLAHEIAMYGFPGLDPGEAMHQFPALDKNGHKLKDLADLIGVTARSHGISLRVCTAYLEKKHSFRKTPRPKGTAVLYPMALLRVADYLQLDKSRAPAVLLQLHDPQSPISIDEWKKHDAVRHIGDTTDPHGVHFDVSADISLSLYLQLEELLTGLQREMDQSTAVLAEYYGNHTRLELDRLVLAKRRVDSNLQSPEFRDSLPYLPQRTGFSADPQLLTLLVEPLYGKRPSVGVREMMQNAVDAVRELEEWCKKPGRSKESLDLPDLGADVLVEFIRRDDGSWFLRVTDRGIGMRGETLANYFLRAGASFRRSPEWTKEFADDSGEPRVTRVGQFGIGAFAIFLLGPSFKLWTRHAGANADEGYSLAASHDSNVIEIRRVNSLSVGTRIEVDLGLTCSDNWNVSTQLLDHIFFDETQRAICVFTELKWYFSDWPRVVFSVSNVKGMIRAEDDRLYSLDSSNPQPEWSKINSATVDAAYWTYDSVIPSLVINGFRISAPMDGPEAFKDFDRVAWKCELLRRPRIAINDRRNSVIVTSQRYALASDTLPFIGELTRDVVLSFIAFTLVCGPASIEQALANDCLHPLQIDSRQAQHDLGKDPMQSTLLRWCATNNAFIPADPWLYSLLSAKKCFVFGTIHTGAHWFSNQPLTLSPSKCSILFQDHHAAIFCETEFDVVRQNQYGGSVVERPAFAFQLDRFYHDGMNIIGPSSVSDVIVSVTPSYSAMFRRRNWTGFNMPNGFRSWKTYPTVIDNRVWLSRTLLLEARRAEFAALFEDWHRIVDDVLLKKRQKQYSYYSLENLVLFIAEITPPLVQKTDSLLSQVWAECLGQSAVPFDFTARQSLILTGCQHPDLRRHIHAWLKLKDSDSDWATGRYRR